ncbi:MAG: radical SAM protein [Deltaproteobacteria bacterium]|nr:radical SAM protein [Deltaproteobacteria bacterium]
MTSRACDLRCRYCYTAAGPARRNELTTEHRLWVLNQAAELGAELLWIPGEGEPLIDPGFWPLLEEAAQLGIWTLFYTSGTQVTEEVARRIADLPCSVVLKVNSLHPEVQNRLADVPGSCDAIHRGIRLIRATGIADQNRVAAETVILPDNLGEIPDIFRFCRSQGILPYIERLLPSGRGAATDLQLDQDVEDHVFSELAAIDREEFGYEWKPHGNFATGLWDCDRIVHTLVVDAAGSVHPCVAIDQPLGDVRQERLAEIWTSRRLMRLRASVFPALGQGTCYCRQYLTEQQLTESRVPSMDGLGAT